jgi:acyl carrier protein
MDRLTQDSRRSHDFLMPSCTDVLATTWDSGFEDRLRQFLPFLGAGDRLAEDASLRELGLDSMGTVELLAVLESGYRVRFRDEALTMANFATPGMLWKTLSEML